MQARSFRGLFSLAFEPAHAPPPQNPSAKAAPPPRAMPPSAQSGPGRRCLEAGFDRLASP